MLMDRIMGAFTFKQGVYAEVEHDEGFTGTAWTIVIVVSALAALGAYTTAGSIGGWLIGTIVTLIFAVIGFALAALVINFVGRSLFTADVSFDELVRVMGLAYVWRVVGVLGILGFLPVLACLVAPLRLIAAILALIAWFIAVKEALDLDWGPTIITVIVGWVVLLVVQLIAGGILTALGIAAGAAANALGG
jgi:hypothetical protein